MIKKDVEEILVGTWLIGDCLEDLERFQPYHFPIYGGVVRELRMAKPESASDIDYVAIHRKTGVSLMELNELMHFGGYPNMYEMAVDGMRKELADEWVENHPNASPEEISEQMKLYATKRIDVPSVSQNPVQDLIDELDRRKEEKPVSTGLRDLDNLLYGVRKKELTAVGARPSVGKSAFLQQVAMSVANQGLKVLFFPLEMSETAIMQRMMLSMVRIPQNEVRNGLSRDTWEKPDVNRTFIHMDEFMRRKNFLIFERCNDINTIKKLIEVHKPYMVAIDQLEQLKDGDKRWEDKRMRFSHMTHEMQAISLDMDVAVWFACQVNRDADNNPPTMANLKESGTIEEDATNVLLLHRNGDKTERQSMQLDLAKQKDGACGVIDLTYHASKFTFYGVERGI